MYFLCPRFYSSIICIRATSHKATHRSWKNTGCQMARMVQVQMGIHLTQYRLFSTGLRFHMCNLEIIPLPALPPNRGTWWMSSATQETAATIITPCPFHKSPATMTTFFKGKFPSVFEINLLKIIYKVFWLQLSQKYKRQYQYVFVNILHSF